MCECSWPLPQAPEDVRMSHGVGSLWSLRVNGCSMHHTEMYFCTSKRLAGYLLVVTYLFLYRPHSPPARSFVLLGGVELAR
jgi:hypothetical protein